MPLSSIRLWPLVIALVALVSAPLRATAETADLSVVHGIQGLPGPVTVLVNGDPAFMFEFGDVVGPLSLEAGIYDFDVALGDEIVLSAADVTLEAGVSYSAVAHRTPSDPICEGDAGIALSLFVNDVSPTPGNKFRATVRHLADAPAVDVQLKRLGRGRNVNIQDLANPDEASAEARSGRYRVKIRPADGGGVVLNQFLGNLRPQNLYLVYAVGSICDGSFRLIVQSLETRQDDGGNDAATALLSVVHGIQGLPEPVTVRVNGDDAFSFDFGEIVGPLPLPVADAEGMPIEYDFEVVLGDVVVLSANDVLLEAGVNYSGVAHRTPSEPICEGDAGITLTLLVNDVSPTDPLKFRATVRHLADAPAVDIDLNRGLFWSWTVATIPGLTNPGEAVTQAYFGYFGVDIFPAGGDEAVFSDHLGLLLPYRSYVVYAVGSICDGSFRLLVQEFPAGPAYEQPGDDDSDDDDSDDDSDDD